MLVVGWLGQVTWELHPAPKYWLLWAKVVVLAMVGAQGRAAGLLSHSKSARNQSCPPISRNRSQA